MKNSLIFGGIIAAVIITALVIMNITVDNKEVRQRNLVYAQQDVCKANFDKMYKVIAQVAEIPEHFAEQSKEAFKEIYPQLMEGRYSNDRGGALMSWVAEQNPTYDMAAIAELYKALQVAIEANRAEYFMEQKQLISYQNQHKNTLETWPGTVFLNDTLKPADIIIITSAQTKASLDEIIIAQNDANDALARKILLAAKETAITEALTSVYSEQVDAVNKIKEEMTDWGTSVTTQNAVIEEFTRLVNKGSTANKAFQIAAERAGLGAISLPSSGIERQVLSLYDSLIEAKDIMDEVSSSYDVLIDSFGKPVKKTGGSGGGGGSTSTSVEGLTPLEILEREENDISLFEKNDTL